MAVIPQLPLIHNLYPSKQEGPHSALNEEEFFDALEMAYHEDETESVSSFYIRGVKVGSFFLLAMSLACITSTMTDCYCPSVSLFLVQIEAVYAHVCTV